MRTLTRSRQLLHASSTRHSPPALEKQSPEIKAKALAWGIDGSRKGFATVASPSGVRLSLVILLQLLRKAQKAVAENHPDSPHAPANRALRQYGMNPVRQRIGDADI